MEEFMRENAGKSTSAFTHGGTNDLFLKKFFSSILPIHYAFSYVSKLFMTLMKLQFNVFANKEECLQHCLAYDNLHFWCLLFCCMGCFLCLSDNTDRPVRQSALI